MSDTLTPEEAFKAGKKLWPSLVKIRRNIGGRTVLCLKDSSEVRVYADVSWPADMDQWPAPPDKWRDAVWPDDWNKPARFRDLVTDRWSTVGGKLIGHDADAPGCRWISSSHMSYRHCQVKVSPNEPDAPGEGWRYLEPYETLREGDEYSYPKSASYWEPVKDTAGFFHLGGKVAEGMAQHGRARRRIVTFKNAYAGDGYRFLDSEEKVIEGDEYCGLCSEKWVPSTNWMYGGHQTSGEYRRRIDVSVSTNQTVKA